MPRRPRVPSLVHHKPTGQARVRLGGRDFYCGLYGTPEAEERYNRLLAEWLSSKPARPAEPAAAAPPRPAVTVNELVLAYWRHAQGYYRKDGRPTGELPPLKSALRPVRRLYGRTPAAEFGPLRLKAVRDELLREGLTRTGINARLSRIRRMFKWAVENELVPAGVHQALTAVEGLKKGRSTAPEARAVAPVSAEDIARTLPYLSRVAGDMVRLQLLTGARPKEVCDLRPCDVEREGGVWEYAPATHKTEHHGQVRRLFLGPQAQAVLGPYLEGRAAGEFCFRPCDARAERLAARHAGRTTPLSCGNRPGTNRTETPKRRPGRRYSVASYRRAVRRACEAAGVPPWSPNRLRHSRATELRRLFGIEAARTVLGHRRLGTTELYAEKDLEQARAIMRDVG